MSAYMPIFEAIAWVGSQGPDLFREVDAERQAEIEAGYEKEGKIVGWLALDQKLGKLVGRNYSSVAAEIFALAEVGQVPSIGRHPGSSTYIDIPKLAYVGAVIDGGIDGFKLEHSAMIDLFDENWCDVQFLRAAIQARWPPDPAQSPPVPRPHKESGGVEELRSFFKHAEKNAYFDADGQAFHTGPQLRDAYARWCKRSGAKKVKPLDRSSYYAKLKDYREGRWS